MKRRALELVPAYEEPIHWYGFDPLHPARGDQPVVRLRRQGLHLAWERGPMGAWTRERERKYDDVHALERDVELERAQWAAAGLELTERELDIVQRSSAREPTLEAAIRADEAPDEAIQVYADWLQRQGDPRGLVAALDLARNEAESTPARERLDQAFAATLLEHHAHLFGPLVEQELVGLRWSGGQVIELEFDELPRSDLQRSELERLEILLGLPICACLRSLKLRAPIDEESVLDACFATCEPAQLAGLREFVIHSFYSLGPLRSFGSFFGESKHRTLLDDSRLPRLERLELDSYDFTPLLLSNLHTLTLGMRSNSSIELLRASLLPRLHTLTLDWFHDERLVSPPLEQLLALPLVASLDTLTMRELGDELWPIELAQTLIDATNLRGVGRVDLSAIAFSDAGYAALVEAQPRLPNFVLGPGDD